MLRDFSSHLISVITNHKCYVILPSKFIDAKKKVAQMSNDIQEKE